MRTATIFAALFAALLASPADAKSYRHHYHVYHVSSFQQGLGIGLLTMLRASRAHHRFAHRGVSYSNLDSACRSAAHQGGPCGCWAQEHFFGSSARLYGGHNLWLAGEWRRVFPHVAAAAGTAAVWPNGHHVAPVVAVNGNGTVTVADSWGTHAVRMAGLTFVNPHGGGSYEERPVYAQRSRRLNRQEAYLRRNHYAGADTWERPAYH